MPMPPSAASSSVEGSGTAAGLPPKSAAGAKAALPPNVEPEDEPVERAVHGEQAGAGFEQR